MFTDLLLCTKSTAPHPPALLGRWKRWPATIDGARPPSPRSSARHRDEPVEIRTIRCPKPSSTLRQNHDGYLMPRQELILGRHQQSMELPASGAIDQDSIRVEDLAAAREEASRVRVEPALLGYIAALARRTREWPSIALGASPRAAIHLMQLAKAVAATDGRDYLLPDDVKRVAPAVLRHRLVIRAEADLEGLTADQVIADVLANVPPSDLRDGRWR